jgi:hypothetical protein
MPPAKALPAMSVRHKPPHGTFRRCGRRALPGAALAAACTLALPGCFDGGAIAQAHQEETDLVRMDEIDIGEFRITLPHAPGEPGGGVVEFQAFGQVPARDREKVAKALALNAPELRYRVLLAVRLLTRGQLEEPNLRTLRGQLTKLANGALDEKLIKSVGFYRFSFAAQ